MSVGAQQRDSTTATPTGPYYEDFSVGQRGAGSVRRPPDPDDRAARRTPTAGLTTVVALASDGGLLPPSLLRVLETHWSNLSPVPVGEPVEATFTVTRCRRVPAEDAGSVQWHLQVHDRAGRTVQEGTIEVLLPARPGSDGAADAAERAFCSRPWAESLARRLAGDEGFRSATATWDGTIGLRAGKDEVHLRVYRGRVIEVAGRTPLGATFTLEGSERLWTDLVTGPSNDFFRRAMSGDAFTVTGNAYEYLRMSKALMALIDAARELATGGRG
ncbi:hypothetical protein [Geodermatophilus sp. DSM 44513]|uniref:hypothetical protein n=1 Tax=Geodermatophilus sp. DSM 44513 TaxID=1528104 RepID=UPI001285CC7C|nr:hypothetical protein [Geodermatophilus sp. DSM 44513]WNV76626.1 hypothetical protein RTG05_04965 [Geodermatophilus sp. DSM 44513]